MSPRSKIVIVVVAITLSIGFVISDSWRRYHRITLSMQGTMGTPSPAIDPTSLTGYELGMRTVILPQVGIDGCQWIMHTQKLLKEGGWRIRYTDADNAPDGREIHWSHGFIWWLIILGHIHSTMTGLPLAASVEAVSPYANTLLLLFLIAGLPWVIFKRFGAFAAAGLAITLSSIYVFYEFFMIGNADHHGIAASGALTCALLLALGGAGWVLVERNPDAKSKLSTTLQSYDYLIDAKSARRYFIGSALAGSVGLWVSAATAVPTFFGIGLGALISVLFFGRQKSPDEPRYEPRLWRWWGLTGCCGSLFFYLLEYFPSHMGMRLEVNHPLYALAWLGGGEILFRLARWRVEGTRPWQGGPKEILGLAGAFSAVLLLPILIMLYPERFFWITDEFLWQFHKDYIHEFKTFYAWVDGRASFQTVLSVALFPLIGVVVFRLIFLSELGRSWKGILTLIVLPAILATCLGLLQVRWLGIANALWLPAVPTALGCLFGAGFPHRFSVGERIVGGLIAGFLFLFFPQTSLRQNFFGFGTTTDLGPDEAFGIYIRDLSHALRRSDPNREMVIISGPSTTTYMMYYGGMKGIGTLYWENVPGLKAAARIYSARTASEALALVERHHISHIAIFASDAFAFQYTRLLRGLPFGAEPKDAFIPSMITNLSSPPWLKPLHFRPPTALPGEWLILLEVRVGQTIAQANFGIAEYLTARGEKAGAINALQAGLALEPENRDAWLQLGALQIVSVGGDEAKQAFEKGLVDRSPTEIANFCSQAALNCFQASRHVESAYLLRRSLAATPNDSGTINGLAWLLATSGNDSVRRPEEALSLALSNTANPHQSTYYDTLAAAQAANGKLDEAIESAKRAIELLSSAVPNPANPDPNNLRLHLQHYEAGKPFRIDANP